MNERYERWTRQVLGWLQRRWRAWRAQPAVPPPPAAEPPRPLPVAAYASVVIPALNEAARIGDVVRYALGDPATAEVIVIDDSSIDDTASLARRAGARVVTSTMLGKGASVRDGAQEARGDLVVFLDGDLAGLQPGIVTDLCRPLLRGEADFVKARFGRTGGRVTELTAKPMLKVFFPELAHFAQPLGGIVAARRALLRSLELEDGYGVDVALLIDAHRAQARLAEVDIGSLEHDSQPLTDLTAMANEVSRVIYARARAAGRLHVEQISALYESQRQATAAIDYILSRRRSRRRLLLLDMDGTVTLRPYAHELAQAVGRGKELRALLGDSPQEGRAERIAQLFRFSHRRHFEEVARAIEIRPDAVAAVNQMRRAGFMVGLVSDSCFVAAEIVRRRIFADFAIAHMLQFDGDVCTGELRLNPAFLPAGAAPPAGPCKSHVVARFRADTAPPALEQVWAVGDDLDDLALLRAADRAFVIDPKADELLRLPGVVELGSLGELTAALRLVPEGVPVSA
jgi:phosphoserine phosphatase/glycosyltransferase involved in cell wall biosynthesis